MEIFYWICLIWTIVGTIYGMIYIVLTIIFDLKENKESESQKVRIYL